MLASALREYRLQQRVAALAVSEVLRKGNRGRATARLLQTYQAAAVAVSLEGMDATLTEQGIATASAAEVNGAALVTDSTALSSMMSKAANDAALAQLVQTFVADAGRTARMVDSATRPAVTAHVRVVNPPACARCAILAGRVYRYSEGFQRHPRCDCTMVPTTEAIGPALTTDPKALFESGGIHGMSAADAEAVRMGADLGQVVNVQRKAAGLTEGSSVMYRAGRLTPNGCLSLASDREDALRLLTRYGYIL